MYSCGKLHPIWGMPPQVQLEFVRTAPVAELDAFWRTMNAGSREEQQKLVSNVADKYLERLWTRGTE